MESHNRSGSTSALPLLLCVALGKLLDLSESLFPHLENGGQDTILLG